MTLHFLHSPFAYSIRLSNKENVVGKMLLRNHIERDWEALEPKLSWAISEHHCDSTEEMRWLDDGGRAQE